MSTTYVTGVVVAADGTPAARQRVTIELVTGGVSLYGQVGGAQKSIGAPGGVRTDDTGMWVCGLTPNVEITNPVNTLYKTTDANGKIQYAEVLVVTSGAPGSTEDNPIWIGLYDALPASPGVTGFATPGDIAAAIVARHAADLALFVSGQLSIDPDDQSIILTGP